MQEDQLEIVVGDHPCQPGRGSPQARTRRLQRALARKKRNSKRRAKARRNLARHHGRVAAARRDFLHKLSHGLASRHRVIAMEDLGMNALKRSFLARSIHDAAWTQLRDILGYKAESAGGSVVLVDPRGTCGREPDRPKTLADRVHGCDVKTAIQIVALYSLAEKLWPSGDGVLTARYKGACPQMSLASPALCRRRVRQDALRP
ncbi:MAG: IS200/IS605 family element transposase accessory protein TnpB [Boseongicola sp. SB0667_bin_21]|nr:IS200/IS605 family element transposase accessory protein TnpB [Boseongicola sp. SB0667_bin_21]